MLPPGLSFGLLPREANAWRQATLSYSILGHAGPTRSLGPMSNCCVTLVGVSLCADYCSDIAQGYIDT